MSEQTPPNESSPSGRRLHRTDLRARYEVFQRFALEDQRAYYKYTINRYRQAAYQVNFIRAGIAFATGFAAALAGLIVQTSFANNAACVADSPPEYCGLLSGFVGLLVVLSVALPALGAAFNSLSDLYQWDRIADVYSSASDSIDVADALSPINDDPDDESYRSALRAYVEGTLAVMSDETAQWGQSIRTPVQLQKFVEEQKAKASQVTKDDPAETDSDSSTPPKG